MSAKALSAFQSTFPFLNVLLLLRFVGFSFDHLLNFTAYSYYFLRLRFLRLTDIENRLVVAKAGQGGGEIWWRLQLADTNYYIQNG